MESAEAADGSDSDADDDVEDSLVALRQAGRQGLGDGGGAEQVGARHAALRDGRPQRADLRRGFVAGETGGDVAGVIERLDEVDGDDGGRDGHRRALVLPRVEDVGLGETGLLGGPSARL